MSDAASTRTNPWHVLGKELDGKYSIDDALELVHGDDFVQPANLYTINNDYTIVIDGIEYVAVGNLEEVQGSIGIKSDFYGTMSTAGPNYEIIQRREVLELAYEITGLHKDDAVVKSIGHIGDRAQVFFAYLELPTLIIDPNGIADVIHRGLYVATSFDGTLATTIGESDMRPYCTNMIHMALRGLERPIRVHHRRNAEERLRQAAQAWEYAGAVEAAKINKARVMLGVPGDIALRRVQDHFWPIDDPELPTTTYTKRKTARDTVSDLYYNPQGTAAEKVGFNGYGVYQAFTEYSDHYRPVRVSRQGVSDIYRRAENSVLPGAAVTSKIKASEIITAIAA